MKFSATIAFSMLLILAVAVDSTNRGDPIRDLKSNGKKSMNKDKDQSLPDDDDDVVTVVISPGPIIFVTDAPSKAPSPAPSRSQSKRPLSFPPTQPSPEPQAPTASFPTAPPSPAPTASFPTAPPSPAPTASFPSAPPSPAPTAPFPSARPSRAATLAPLLGQSPTAMPSSDTSVTVWLPSDAPSTEISSLPPTRSRSSSLPSTPSEPPNVVSDSPQLPPSKEVCFPDDDGLFGSVSGREIVVGFAYELETIGIPNDAIPDVQRAFAAAVLAALFANECGDPNDMGHRRLDGATFGVTTIAPDKLVEGVRCEALKGRSNSCIVVKGQMKLYVDRRSDGTTEKDAALQVLESGTTNDEFLYANDSIARVALTELKIPEPLDSDIRVEVDPRFSNAPSNSYSWLWAIPVGVALAGVVFVSIYFRNQKEYLDDEMDDAMDEFLDDAMDDVDAYVDDDTIGNDSVYTSLDVQSLEVPGVPLLEVPSSPSVLQNV